MFWQWYVFFVCPNILFEKYIILIFPAFSSFLQSRKRFYFGLEEMDNRLVYYRSKADFDLRKDCLGQIPIEGIVCTLIDGNMRAFTLQSHFIIKYYSYQILYYLAIFSTSSGKKYQFEADNEQAAECWLDAMQKRREKGLRGAKQKRNEADEGGAEEEEEGPLVSVGRRDRSGSGSFGRSDSESDIVASAGLQRQRSRTNHLLNHRQSFLPRPF